VPAQPRHDQPRNEFRFESANQSLHSAMLPRRPTAPNLGRMS
jgi:hypothetical protein